MAQDRDAQHGSHRTLRCTRLPAHVLGQRLPHSQGCLTHRSQRTRAATEAVQLPRGPWSLTEWPRGPSPGSPTQRPGQRSEALPRAGATCCRRVLLSPCQTERTAFWGDGSPGGDPQQTAQGPRSLWRRNGGQRPRAGRWDGPWQRTRGTGCGTTMLRKKAVAMVRRGSPRPTAGPGDPRTRPPRAPRSHGGLWGRSPSRSLCQAVADGPTLSHPRSDGQHVSHSERAGPQAPGTVTGRDTAQELGRSGSDPAHPPSPGADPSASSASAALIPATKAFPGCLLSGLLLSLASGPGAAGLHLGAGERGQGEG